MPISAHAQALLDAYVPLPNNGVQSYLAATSQPTNWREELIKVDHNLTDKHRLTLRYIHDSWDTVTPTPLWTNAGSFPTIQTAFFFASISLTPSR